MFNPLLTSFVCVADCGSFNRAAEKLYISSTAVIKQINALERHLDLRLFERTNHGIALTPAGQVILPACAADVRRFGGGCGRSAGGGWHRGQDLLCRYVDPEPL